MLFEESYSLIKLGGLCRGINMMRLVALVLMMMGLAAEVRSANFLRRRRKMGDGVAMHRGMMHGMGKGVPMHLTSCVVTDIAVQSNFNIQQYVGTWFTVSHAEGSDYPFHRRSHYSLQENGFLGMTTRRVYRQEDGCENSTQFEAYAYLAEGAADRAKLLLQPRGFDVPPEDYWVVYTDYIDHALVYSCTRVNDAGMCVEGADHVWFLSRRGTLSLGARSHMMSLLPDLCVDAARMTDVLTDCDAAFGVSNVVPETTNDYNTAMTPGSCSVSDIQTMAGFDKAQYIGTWYVISHLQDGIYPYNRISHYSLNRDGVLNMTTHRISSPNDCTSAWRFNGQAYNPETTEEASKLVLKPFGMPVYGEDYWVIYTDYTHHSLVYSCQERDEDGTCLGGASHAWLLSRSPTMPAAARSHMEMLLTEMCVDVANLVDTPHECDEVLGLEMLANGSDANECVVHSFQTMQDFDKSQYVGTWYVASYLQDEVYPYQRISQYSLESDGSLTMTTDRVIRSTSCSSPWHFEATAAEQGGSPASSKLLLKPRGMDVEGEDYWIVYTDYTDYALVYSCSTKNLDGTCLEGASHAWLLSRKPRLSDIAHSHMVSLLTDLCVDPMRLIDTPTECDDELGVSEASRCDVSNFEVMENFDPSQYVGPWYMISHLQDHVYPYHRISNYDLAEDGSIIMTTDRIVSPGECDSAKTFEVKATPNAVGGARMLLKPVGIPAGGEDYWVVYTDYVDHALVYSCGRRNLDGTCQEGATHAWMISRGPTLSQGARSHMEMLLGGLCIDPNRLVDTPSECDAVLETGLRRPVVELVARSCIVDEFQVMENFDIHQYAGQWYTVSQIQPFEYPFHRFSNYTMQENGRLLMSTDQFFRPGSCSTMHFEAEAFHEPTMQLAEGEQRNGKLFLDPVDDSVPPGSYWVIYANYSDHALVYSCLRRDEEGVCLRGYAMVWFMSRKPTLDQRAMNDMLSLLPNLCINPSLLKNVITDCDEEIGIVSEQAPVPCAISNFGVKENFVIDKFMGDWYELSHTDSDVYMNVPDMEMISFGRPAADSDADISVTMKNIRLNGVCNHKNMPGHGWLGQSQPAKFTLSFPLIPDGYDVPEVVNHWVLDTDYISYAITYTCHQIKPDGSCDPGSQGLWVLGRERRITPEFWITIQAVIKRACMRPRNVVPNPESCPDYVPRERSQDDPRSCEQNVFGCCLLSDDAAIDSDFSNCPRVAPPVAGRFVPEAPVNIVDGTVHCEQRMNCKMFCRLGFKRNADNCEICECAEEPTSGTPPPISLSGECQTRYEQIMAKLKNNSPRKGFFVPNCDAQGNYFPLQCLYPEIACWCADPISGDRLSKARYDGDAPSCDL